MFKGSKRSAFGVLPLVIRTVWWSKRGAGGVLPSLIRMFSGSKRNVLEGPRGSYLCVLKVVRVWSFFDDFGG